MKTQRMAEVSELVTGIRQLFQIHNVRLHHRVKPMRRVVAFDPRGLPYTTNQLYMRGDVHTLSTMWPSECAEMGSLVKKRCTLAALHGALEYSVSSYGVETLPDGNFVTCLDINVRFPSTEQRNLYTESLRNLHTACSTTSAT